MSQSSGQSLQFTINESVWLRDGEKAEEILSMALEPDITIEENPQYVTIKGALRLSGEYKPTASDDTDETVEDYGRPSYRTVDEVTETDVGTVLIEHRFPVDITIPTGRIADIDDLLVTVESFDYHQPDKGCIQLEAEITISGLVDDRNAEEPPATESDVDYDPTEVVQYESYREPEVEEVTEEPQIELNQRSDGAIPHHIFENFFDEDPEEEEPDSRYEETPSLMKTLRKRKRTAVTRKHLPEQKGNLMPSIRISHWKLRRYRLERMPQRMKQQIPMRRRLSTQNGAMKMPYI